MAKESRRGSDLLTQLGRAQRKISTLEEFIRERERQFHVAVSRPVERRESRAFNRLRRVGLSSDLLRMRSVSRDEPPEDSDIFLQPLREYVCLRLCRILEREEGSEDGGHVPFILRRLRGRHYHVGPEGVLIGSGSECSIRMPHESQLWEKHVALSWVQDTVQQGSKLVRQDRMGESGGHFVLEDLTRGEGQFRVLPSNEHELAPVDERADQSDEPFAVTESHRLHLVRGVRFIAGCMEWSVTALPHEVLLTHKTFAAAQSGNFEELRSLLEGAKLLTAPYIFVSSTDSSTDTCPKYSTVSVATDSGIDVNIEFQPPSYSDDSYFNQLLSSRRSSLLPSSPLSPLTPGSLSPQPSRLLLHITIEQFHPYMVKYLLEKGANPNLCVGEQAQNALHLASRKNQYLVMVELLRFGGDVEITDSRHLQPLALTTSYDIRKLLLSTVLLCCAAEAGDCEEVVRLLSHTAVSPNALGLRHKNALHLAAAQGHAEVVELLLMNGASVKAKGGSHQRTALHYASVNDHVAVARLLLQAGASEFARDVGGYTPLNLCLGGEMCKLLHKQPLSLCLAVQSGDVEVAGEILRGGVGVEGEDVRLVDQRNEQSHAPLHLACAAGNLEMAGLLVAHGADVNLHGGSDGWTPLWYAAMGGHSVMVEFLLSVGANTEELDGHDDRLQEHVEKAVEGMKERISSLEKMGRSESVAEQSLHTLIPANMLRQESATSCSVESELIWLRDRYDRLRSIVGLLTSGPEQLLRAMETRDLHEFTSLLESGSVSANVLVDKHSPTSALVRACEDGLYGFTEALLKNGANPSPAGTRDQVPILVAAGNGHSDLLPLLVKYGADANVQCCDTLSTPIHEAASTNSLESVQALLSLGADKTATNAAGETPFNCTLLPEIRKLLAFGASCLLVAVSAGDHGEVERLVNGDGVAVDHVFSHGVTALHEACEGGQEECVRVLLSLGADVNKQSLSSLASPLHLASQCDHLPVVNLLLEAGARLDTKDSEGRVPFEVAASNTIRKVLVEARTVRAPPVAYLQEKSNERTCMICMDNPINTILLPCGHQAFCTDCVSRITDCALDRQPIREVITVYK